MFDLSFLESDLQIASARNLCSNEESFPRPGFSERYLLSPLIPQHAELLESVLRMMDDFLTTALAVARTDLRWIRN